MTSKRLFEDWQRSGLVEAVDGAMASTRGGERVGGAAIFPKYDSKQATRNHKR